jgi:hypothetical protein
MKKRYTRGDVASIFFPNQEDPTQATEHYAIVIEDFGDEFILVPLTKQVHQKKRYPRSIEVKKDSQRGRKMGLLYDSLIVIERALQLPKLKITPPNLGVCPEELINEIMDVLEELGLP